MLQTPIKLAAFSKVSARGHSVSLPLGQPWLHAQPKMFPYAETSLRPRLRLKHPKGS